MTNTSSNTSTLQLSFRDKSRNFLANRSFFITIATVCLVLSMIWGAAGYYLGMGMVLLTAWANRWKFSIFGLRKTFFLKDLIYAILISALLYILVDGLVQPLVEIFFGEINLESFEALKGNLPSYLIFLGVMWIAAALGEELFYRGYLMKGIAGLLGDKHESWFLAAFFSAVYFGLAHLYQGTSGVITTGIIGFIMGLIFMERKNLWLLVLIHGIYDTIGITLLYLNKENWIHELINF